MPLQGGRLRKRVFLLKLSTSQDSVYGEYTRSYVSQGRVWASVEPISAKEQFQDGALIENVSHKVWLRYRDNFFGTYIILYENEWETVDANLTDVGTTVTVADGTQIGNVAPYYARIEEEIVKVTAGFGTTSLTVSRGQFSTTAAAHSSGDKLFKLNALNVNGVTNFQERNESLMLTCNVTTEPFDA